MTFKTVKELEDYIKKQAELALIMAQEEVYRIVQSFVDEYYSSYAPQVYERTGQLYRSLVRGEIKASTNGYKAYVYFDLEKLDYSMKRLTKWRDSSGQYMNPFNYDTSSDGWFKNSGYSNEKTLESAMKGLHGGLDVNTSPIWSNSLNEINRNIIPIFKKYLKQNRIPIK